MLYLIVFFTSLIITIFTMPYWIEYLESREIVDNPTSARKIHTVPTPRMGGLIIYLMAVISLYIYNSDSHLVRMIILGSFGFAVIGVFDDLWTMHWKIKFLLQSLNVLFLLYALKTYFNKVEFFSITIPYPFDQVLLFIFILGTINSINLMDGMDGLVGGFSLLVLVVILVLAFTAGSHIMLILCASLLGGCLGFLKYNASPARIFLGDSGSLTLGYFLVVLTILTSIEQFKRTLDLTFAVIILAVPIIDTLKVMFVRIYNGNSMFLPDKNHLHHIVLGTVVKSKTTVFLILSLSLLFITDALIYLKYSKIGGIILFGLLGNSLLQMKYVLRTSENLAQIELFQTNLASFSRNTMLKIKEALVYISSLISFILMIGFFPYSAGISKVILLTLMIILILMLTLAFFTYRKTKSTSDIYVFLNLVIFLGLSFFSDSVVASHFLHSGNSRYFFFIAILMLLTLVVFFIICKNCYPIEKKSFLTGLDLILISLISLIFILHRIFDYQGYLNLGVNGFYALVIYIWYKIISGIEEKYHILLYRISFIIPFAAMVYNYFS